MSRGYPRGYPDLKEMLGLFRDGVRACVSGSAEVGALVILFANSTFDESQGIQSDTTGRHH